MEYGKKFQKKPVTQDITQTTTSLSIDLTRVRVFIITLQSNLTTITVSNIQKGEEYEFVFIQDATGGRTVTFPAELQFEGDLNTAISAVTVYSGTAYSTSFIKGGAGSVSKASQAEAETGTNDAKYLTPNKGYLGWLSWVANKTVSALNTTVKTIVGGINENKARIDAIGTQSSYEWTWDEGVSGGGDTYQDFVITGATAGEIPSIASCILFVGGAIQTGNYSVVTTTVTNDTIRITAASTEAEATDEVVLFYNKISIATVGIDGGDATGN